MYSQPFLPMPAIVPTVMPVRLGLAAKQKVISKSAASRLEAVSQETAEKSSCLVVFTDGKWLLDIEGLPIEVLTWNWYAILSFEQLPHRP